MSIAIFIIGGSLLCYNNMVLEFLCSWEDAIKRAMIGQDDLLSTELPSSPIGNELSGGLGISSLTSSRGKFN